MCQIFSGTAAKIIDALLNKPGVLESLIKRNKDGLGAMYATSKHVLKMPKLVPKDLDEARAFIAQLPADERNLVIHFRMKTSGKIDHDNAHPFVVLDGQMGMTHNGILSISTKSDETKCDTRHYIERYLRPMLTVAPQMAYVPEWLEIVGNDIGSNRFVLMNNEGRLAYVNYYSGYEMDGYWIANTYSFDAQLLDEKFKPKTTTYATTYATNYGGWSGRSMMDDDWDDDGKWGGNVKHISAKKKPKPAPLTKVQQEIADVFFPKEPAPVLDQKDIRQRIAELDDDVWTAVKWSDADAMTKLLEDAPITVMATLFRLCEYVPHKSEQKHSEAYQNMTDALVAHDLNKVLELVGGLPVRYGMLAQCICWYGEWVGKAINKKDDAASDTEGEKSFIEMTAVELKEAIDKLEDELSGLEEEESEVKYRMETAKGEEVLQLERQLGEIAVEREIVKKELEAAEDAETAILLGRARAEIDGIIANLGETTKEVVTEHQAGA